MSAGVMVQYVGFECKPREREYTFNVREEGVEAREFTVTISNEAFGSHRARFQDAPDICSRRLIQELTSSENHPLINHFCVTDTDLDAYRSTHPQKPFSRFPSHKKEDEA